MSLQITTLAGKPVEETRYWVPRMGEAGSAGYVIILEPVRRDWVGAPPGTPDEERYGAVRVLTDDGTRVVSSLGLGVLVRES